MTTEDALRTEIAGLKGALEGSRDTVVTLQARVVELEALLARFVDLEGRLARAVESPDLPLCRTVSEETIRFDTATVTLEGVLPPGFSGPVATAAQDLFRPLELVLDPGEYSILLSGTRYRAGCSARALSITETSALCVGGFVAVWLENTSQEPKPFRLRLRGHSGRAYRGHAPPMNEEVGCSSVVLGMIASPCEPDPARNPEAWKEGSTLDLSEADEKLFAERETKCPDVPEEP